MWASGRATARVQTVKGVMWDCACMTTTNDQPKTICEVIDLLECIREELFSLQKSLEKMEATESNDEAGATSIPVA